MPASRSLILEQIARFHDFQYFPKTDVGRADLVSAFLEACDTDEFVRTVASYLIATVETAPKPATIYKAAEHLAQTRLKNCEAPSPYSMPGSFEGSLTDGMTVAELQRWRRLADGPSDTKAKRAIRDVARGIVEDYQRRNPHLAIKETGS